MAHPPSTPVPLGNGAGDSRPRNGTAHITGDLDEHSIQIIRHLQEDGRRAYAAIGKSVGLSESSVRQRVQRLVRIGAIQIVAVTDPMTAGVLRQTMVGIQSSGDLEGLAAELAGIAQIDYVAITAGSFDLLVKVVCNDDEELLRTLKQIRDSPKVAAAEAFVYLKVRKQTYTWMRGAGAAGAIPRRCRPGSGATR